MYRLLAGLALATLAAAAPSNQRVVVENGAICEGKASAFFVVDNTMMTAGDNVIYKDFSEEECLSTCSTNRDPFGRSILCSSFVYDHVAFTCTIYKDKSKPEGNGEKTAVQGKRYFEKFCLSSDLPMECADGRFIRSDDSVLVGFATNVSLSETLEDCVATCVRDKGCLSAMYFYEEGECITNTESAQTRPAAFTKEDTEKVLYFSNGCLAKKSSNAKTFKTPTANTELVTDAPKPTTTTKSHAEDYDRSSAAPEGSGQRESGEKSGKPATGMPPAPKKDTDQGKEEEDEEEVEEEVDAGADGEKHAPKGEEYDDGGEAARGDEEEEEEGVEVTDETGAENNEEEEEGTESTTTTPKTTAAPTETEETTIVESEDVDGETTIDEERQVENEFMEPATEAAPRKHSNDRTKILKFNKPAREFGSKTVQAYKEDRKTKKKAEQQQKMMEEVDTEDEEEEEAEEEEEPVNVRASAQAGEFLPKPTETTVNPALLFSEWSDWTPCTKSGERRVRRRKCLDLRRCLGALMQVENCPAVTTVAPVPDDYDQPPLESVRSIVPEPKDSDYFADQGARPVPLPPAPVEKSGVWSNWLGVCQQFASGQPCNNGEMIGFESRECLAKDPDQCTGPFFRYCTLHC
ncbi:unnamed protein product, partial [Mesorhabditis spiculigera]